MVIFLNNNKTQKTAGLLRLLLGNHQYYTH